MKETGNGSQDFALGAFARARRSKQQDGTSFIMAQ
jgi:hypothetical protein